MYYYGIGWSPDEPRGTISPITLFHGDEYFPVPQGYVGFGWFGSKIVHSVTHFVSNTVKTAGREVGHVTSGIQSVTGVIGKGIGKIPIVGKPLHTVFDVSFHMALAPLNMTVAIAEGERIDRVALGQLKEQLHEFKQVAPYAQMVISLVPGIGQGVGAALAAGLALSEGQSIEEALKAGVIGAMPGGPLVQSAVTMAVDTVQRVAKGESISLASLAQTAGGAAGTALGLSGVAKDALMAGISATGAIASGKPIDKAITDSAISALPVSETVKKSMAEASALSLDLAHGKKLDAAMKVRLNAIVSTLPSTNPLHQSVNDSLNHTTKAGSSDHEQLVATALQSGLADTLISMGAQSLPSDSQKAIKAGLALGSGAVVQEQRKGHIAKVAGKLTESGIQQAKISPLFAEARKIAAAKNATKGFDIASGLLQQQVGVFDITTVRNGLDPTQKIGFDIAVAVRIGAVGNPKPDTLSPAAHAGHAITLGMQSYDPDQKAAIMQTIQTNPSATVGATVAVKQVAQRRDSWVARLLKALRLSH